MGFRLMARRLALAALTLAGPIGPVPARAQTSILDQVRRLELVPAREVFHDAVQAVTLAAAPAG